MSFHSGIRMIVATLFVLSACAQPKVDCTDIDPPRKGWLHAAAQAGEVSLRSEPTQFAETRAVVAFESTPGGESVAASAIRQCPEPDGMYYFVVLDDTRAGWVEGKYFSSTKP